MAVRIRLKKMGRRHRPYFRICAMDSRTPRDGKAIEELGTYDPMIRDTDKRCTMKADRVDYWLGVGALPTEKVKILIDKYKGKVPDLRIEKAKVPEIPQVQAPPPKPEQETAAEAEAEKTPAEEQKAPAESQEPAAEATQETAEKEPAGE